MSKLTEAVKSAVRATLPLAARKPLAAWMAGQTWMPRHKWWATELLTDWASINPNAYHRFLWSHHLGYAESYEIDQRFGEENIHPSRRMLFDDLLAFFQEHGKDPARDISSVFEVGASMGYLLHYLEQHVFTSAERLHGIDIDEYAVAEGRRHLDASGSRVTLAVGDMGDMEGALAGQTYDLILCAGVLMYLKQEDALTVVDTMLRHTRGFLILAGLAQPGVDNRELEHSTVREMDGSFVHNLDEMVKAAGGTVLYRRWEGDLDVDGNTIYFLFCASQHQHAEKAGAA
jgi:2-polyprenyl-3-methyl-5-hydroxy-6-metoxy-1,4-benzoquinol methylase